MSVYDSIPDRDELRATARTRVRRGRLAVFGILLLAGSAITATALVTADPAPSPGRALLMLLPVALTVAVVGALYPWTRRQDRDPQLVAGADTSTRRAVQKALRTGTAPDPRVDALARDVATRSLRHTWIAWMIGGSVALQAAGMALRATQGPLTTKDLALIALMALSAVLVVSSTVLTRHRSRRYLRRASSS